MYPRIVENLRKTGYIYNQYDKKVEELTYQTYLYEYGSDECTSPRGVMNRVFYEKVMVDRYWNKEKNILIDKDEFNSLEDEEQKAFEWIEVEMYAIKQWGYDNRLKTVITFDDEDDAILYEAEWMENNLEKNHNVPEFYDNKDDAIVEMANVLEKPFEVIERYMIFVERANKKKKEAEERSYIEYKKKCEERNTNLPKIIEEIKSKLTPEKIEDWTNPDKNTGNANTRRTRWSNRAARLGFPGEGTLVKNIVYELKR